MLKASSSLFGKAKNTPLRATPITASYATARSALFGDVATGKSVPGNDQASSGSLKFQSLVERINSTLVIVPTIPKVRRVIYLLRLIANITN